MSEAADDRASTPEELAEIEELFVDWINAQLDSNAAIAAFERSEDHERAWFVRVLGDDKDSYTVLFVLGQRTLAFETYFLPEPVENQVQFYNQLLRRNRDLFGVSFCIGEEDAVFLAGHVRNAEVSEATLDRVVGTIYATVERCFRPALRVGFGSRLEERSPEVE